MTILRRRAGCVSEELWNGVLFGLESGEKAVLTS